MQQKFIATSFVPGVCWVLREKKVEATWVNQPQMLASRERNTEGNNHLRT